MARVSKRDGLGGYLLLGRSTIRHNSPDGHQGRVHRKVKSPKGEDRQPRAGSLLTVAFMAYVVKRSSGVAVSNNG